MIKKIVTYRAWCRECANWAGPARELEVHAHGDMAEHKAQHKAQMVFDLEAGV